MLNVSITMTGETSLLMHSDTLADPLLPEAKAFKKISGKKVKTEEDYKVMAHMEFIASIYFDDGFVGIPGRNIMKCLIEGARVTKMGPKVERGVTITGRSFPLEYEGPRTPEELYMDKNFVSRMTVKVGMSKNVRCRPIFRKWGATATALIDPSVVSVEELQDIAHNAGQLIGLGDYRRGGGFGRFSAVVEAV